MLVHVQDLSLHCKEEERDEVKEENWPEDGNVENLDRRKEKKVSGKAGDQMSEHERAAQKTATTTVRPLGGSKNRPF